ncbi:amidase family protein, partial [Candidatus Frankia alpina]
MRRRSCAPRARRRRHRVAAGTARRRRRAGRRPDPLSAWWDRFDLPVTPVLRQPPWPLGSPAAPVTRACSTYPFSLTGQPAMSLPLPTGADGLPIGVQIVGRHGDDLGLLQIAAALETATGGPSPPVPTPGPGTRQRPVSARPTPRPHPHWLHSVITEYATAPSVLQSRVRWWARRWDGELVDGPNPYDLPGGQEKRHPRRRHQRTEIFGLGRLWRRRRNSARMPVVSGPGVSLVERVELAH